MFDTDPIPDTGHYTGFGPPSHRSAGDHARALAAGCGDLDAEGLLDAVINRDLAGDHFIGNAGDDRCLF